MKKTLFIWSVLIFSFIKTNAQQANIDSLKRELVIAKEDTTKVKLLWQLSIAYAWSYPDTGVS